MRKLLLLLLLVPIVARGDQAAGLQKGFASDKISDFGGIDSINTFNGNLNLRIPIGQSYPVGGTLTYSLSLSYNSKVWDYESYGTSMRAEPSRRSNAGMGWILSLGRFIPTNDPSNDTHGPLYESPDGGDRTFPAKLHESDAAQPLPPGVFGVGYTRDGTYLRMTDRSYTQLDHPSGMVYRFDKATGNLSSITDGAGNWVYVTYTTSPAGTPCLSNASWIWRINDSKVARTNYVCFENSSFQYNGKRVERIVLAAPPAPGGGARTATWQFTYATQPAVRRGCHSTLQNDPLYIDGVPRLSQLLLPDGSRYSFRYNTEHTNVVCESGTLSGLTLPTGASIDYIYRNYTIPVQSEYCGGIPWRQLLTGVHTRTVSGPNIDTGTWTYTSSLNNNGAYAWCLLNTGQLVSRPGPAEELTVTVTDPQNNVTEHLYSVWPGAEWHFPGGGQTGFDPSPNGFVLKEFGQSFTRMPGTESGSGYLSRRTYSSAGYAAVPRQPKRSYFLQQERDEDGPCGVFIDGCRPANLRTKFARTMFHDDGDKTTDVTHSDFDGLGHYRTTVTTGSFGSPIMTTTSYNKRVAGINPDRGIDSGTYPVSFSIPGIDEPWVLNTAPKVSRLESGQELVSQQCFDPATGLLLARRSLKNSSQIGAVDLLALFEYANGDMTAESYFGGDTLHNAPTTGTLCGIADAPPTGNEYRLTHGYTAGVRSSSQYAGVSFLFLNRSIHGPTGLPLSDTDVSGAKTTTFEYDTSSRLTKLSPPDDAVQNIVYTNAGTNPARVEVTTGASQQHYLYDSLGRLWREKRLMADGTWALRETRRNNIGWIASTSEFETMTAGELTFAPSHLTVFSDYDPFGRPGQIRKPDNKSVTVLYAGKRTVTRVHQVATSAAGESTVQDTEVSDPHGRLVRVNEDANGIAASTYYTYHVSGALATVSMSDGAVTQTRHFNYDGRGLLGSESHPESGTTTYDYDSRGHVRKQQAPAATLTFAYDPAERMTLLSQTGIGVLKEFTWDRANSGNDYSFGKLDAAKRHNRVLNTDIVVTETYKYQGDGGRISSRQTDVSGYGKFNDGYTYDDLGQTSSVIYPWCNNCSGLNAPPRTVDNFYTREYLTRVGGYTSQNNPMTYHANGMLASMQHLDVGGSPGPTFTQTPDHGMPRPAQISVSGFCEFGLQTPLQPKTVPHGQPANLTVDAPAATSFQWYERTGGSDSLLAGQTTATLTVTITSARLFWVRVGNGSCTVDSNVVQVSVGGSCSPPGATITAVSSMEAGSSSAASVTQTTGATYAWSIPDGSGTITSPAGQPNVTFTASCAAAAVTLQVTVTASCGSPSTVTKSIAVWKPSAALSGGTTINPGQTATLTVSLTGTGPWTIGWSDGATTTSSTPTHSRNVSPSSTTMYTLTFVTNAWNCSGTTSGSATVTVTTCSIPPSTITAASSMEAGSFGSASVPSTAGAFYAWTIPDGSGTITSASNQRTVTFAASCHATAVTLEATVTASCGASSVSTKSIAIVKPTAALSGSTTIPQGGSATLTVTLTGTAPWTITWSDGATTTASASPSTRTVSPATTTPYTLTSVKNAYNCAGTTSGSATVTVTNPPPPSPTNVVATATSATTIRITWLASGNPDSFNVERRNGSGAYVVMAYNAPNPFNDNAPPNQAYQYRVIAIKAGVPSAPSAPDLATTVIFEDVLTPGSTLVRAQHIYQLRTAVNAVRATAGFAAATFTDPSLTGVSPKLEHVTELKTALDEALPWLGLPPTAYTGPPPARGGEIRAEHLTRLRDGVQ